MAISFEESKAASSSVQSAATVAYSLSAEPAVAAVDDTETWTRQEKYRWYESYRDDKTSTIDSLKNIVMDQSQINLTQETNSQYIPFQIQRYWDGVDLVGMTLQIHFVNKDKGEDYVVPVNVEYSENKIRFGWLVTDSVTCVEGEVAFEICAVGVNEKGENYVWKTRPNGKLNILKSLAGNGVIEPSTDWYTQFVAEMDDKVGQAMRYAVEAKSAAQHADEVSQTVSSEVDTKLSNVMENVDTKIDTAKQELRTEMADIDGLAKFNAEYDEDAGQLKFYNGDIEIDNVPFTMEPNAEWVTAYGKIVDSKVDEKVAPVQTELTEYKTANDTRLGALEDSVKDLPDTLQSDYYKKTEVDEKLQDKADTVTVAGLQNAVSIAENNVRVMQTSVDALNSDVGELKERMDTIGEVKTNEYEATYEDNVFSLLENGEVKNQFTIVGGSGGGGGEGSSITITRIGEGSLTSVLGETVLVRYNFQSIDSAGDDTGDATAVWYVGNTMVTSGTIQQGENVFDATEYLRAGNNTLKLRITDSMGSIATKNWTVNLVEFYLESSFDDSLFYTGEVLFRYTPYGSIDKIVHFELDGAEVGTVMTSSTGRQMSYSLPEQEYGAHLLKVYMTATINGVQVESNSVIKDILWVGGASDAPAISCAVREFTVRQYSSYGIEYTVYDPNTASAQVTLGVDGETVQTVTVGRTKQIWTFKSADVGPHTLTITCRDTVKTIQCEVTSLGIDVEPVTTNLAFDFNPAGKSNADLDGRLWTNGKVSMSVSDNFDWVNGGYQLDEDGDTYFCVKAGTTAVLDYLLFGDDAKKTGKNFKFVYRTANVRDYDAKVLDCTSGGIGLAVNAQKAELRSEQNSVDTAYCEDDYMEFELNILPDAQYREMVLWMDAIPTKVKLYAESDSFTQTAPVGITIGSADCDVHVYRMKAYTMNLTDDEILDNHIADAKNADEMANRWMRNRIVDASGNIDPDILAENCPELRVIKLSAPRFTAGKKNEIGETTVQHIYKGGRTIQDNWTATGSHKGQGTSSDNYGEAGRNIDVKLSGGFTFADGSTGTKYAMTENSVAENYFNIKVNIASSENANNAVLADEHNLFNPHISAAKEANPKVRYTMEFHPCVIFVQETDVENATLFKDGKFHFYACGDFGNSKKNSDTMGMNPENHKEFIVELDNNTSDQNRFLSDDLSGETWDGDGNVEFRYSNPDCTEEELQAGKDAYQALLTWVVNSTPETFVAEFEDHFVKDSVLFDYLFTCRHLMVDNRAKNKFFHTVDLIHWDLDYDYDNDTANGNDNEGGLTLSYGYEDTDMIGTKAVFNAHDSKLWCSVRDYFADDLDALYIQLEGKLAWNAQRILKKFEDYQGVKPERLVIADMRRKYFRTYEDNGTTSYLPMMNGDKKHQRRQFERYHGKYEASRHVGAECTSDVMTIRGYTPTEWAGVEPDGTFHIKPYADTYIVCRYGSNLVKVRGKRGVTYEIQSPIAAMNDTEVYVYNASLIQSIGSIAGFYPGYVDFGQGIKLTDLSIGSGEEGYANTNLTDFDIGNNVLLEHLDLRNVPNLKKSISLRGCGNLVSFYAEGSGITGVEFAPGGKITTAHLPASIASLTARNILYMTDFVMAGYDNLTTLILENSPSMDAMGMVNAAQNLARTRLTGLDWTLEDTAILERLLSLGGVDENGYVAEQSVVAGKAFVPIVREQYLRMFMDAWKDLIITYNTMIQQFIWTFKNGDEEVDIQYIDKGECAVDPVTRSENPIAIPTKESTVSTVFTFKGWDTEFAPAFSNQIVQAVYDEAVRQYRVRYMNKGEVLQEHQKDYASTDLYEGETPVYTTEEVAYKYHLFKEWDKSGFVDGDKDIEAVYDTCEYTSGYFDGKDLSELRPVEIYAMIQTGNEGVVSDKDSISFSLGNDFSFTDITQKTLIDKKTIFNGTNYVDTQEALFSEDRSFVLAVDYKFEQNTNGSVLAQCYETNGMNGFRLWYNSNATRTAWSTNSEAAASVGVREMMVLRHIKGENSIHVYFTDKSSMEVRYAEIERTKSTMTNATLVFGCSKADDGVYENFAKGTVYWAKVWYVDLGDRACRQLAAWPHEEKTFEMTGNRRYYLSNNTSKRCSMTFLCTTVLDGTYQLNTVQNNTGGWPAYTLNTYLNTRMVDAFPVQWRQLIKTVKVPSSAGGMSTEIVTGDSMFYIPSIAEINPTFTSEPYCYEGTAISFMAKTDARVRMTEDGVAKTYFTRSPNASYSGYVYVITDTGNNSGYYYPTDNASVVLMFSI